MAKPRLKFASRLRRFYAAANFLAQIWKARGKPDAIYLTISESVLGNLKDLAIYAMCYGSLDRFVIHLHGGANMARLMGGQFSSLRKANTFFLHRMKAVIILGESFRTIYQKAVHERKLHIVPNFAEDHLFLDSSMVEEKFHKAPVQILFLSNLLEGKGHIELLEAFISLQEKQRAEAVLNFAGAFPSVSNERDFVRRLSGLNNVRYHGVVRGDAKKALLAQAHLFCLPTYYRYEGQPISILEAYANGCVVLSTHHAGIRDIFIDKVNGLEVKQASPQSIEAALEWALEYPEEVAKIGRHNRIEAERYRVAEFVSSVESIITA